MYGVVTTKLSARPWNRWGLMTKYFDYDQAADYPALTTDDLEEIREALNL